MPKKKPKKDSPSIKKRQNKKTEPVENKKISSKDEKEEKKETLSREEIQPLPSMERQAELSPKDEISIENTQDLSKIEKTKTTDKLSTRISNAGKTFFRSYGELAAYSVYSLAFVGIPITAIFNQSEAAITLGAVSFISKILHNGSKNYNLNTQINKIEEAIKRNSGKLGINLRDVENILGKFDQNFKTAVWNGVTNALSTACNISVTELLSVWLPECTEDGSSKDEIEEDPVKQWLVMGLGALTAALIIYNHWRAKAMAERQNKLHSLEVAANAGVEVVNSSKAHIKNFSGILGKLGINTDLTENFKDKFSKEQIKNEQRIKVQQLLKTLGSVKDREESVKNDIIKEPAVNSRL